MQQDDRIQAYADKYGMSYDDAVEVLLGRQSTTEQVSPLPPKSLGATQPSQPNIAGPLVGSIGTELAKQGIEGALTSDSLPVPNVVSVGGTPVNQGGGILSGALQTAAPIAASLYGANAIKDFATGDRLSNTQKAAMALPTAGLSLFSDTLQDKFKIGQPSGKDILSGRINALSDKGVDVSDADRRVADYGLSKEQLVDRESTRQDLGEWGNAQFAQSRNEADLKPEDVWGGLPMYEIYGNEWDAMSPRERWEASQAMLDDGLIGESRGQLWIGDAEAARAAGDSAIAGERELSTQYEDGWYANNVDTMQEAAPQEGGGGEQVVQERGGGNGPMKTRPKPMNKIPEFEEEESTPPPLIQPPPPQPTLKSPQDYAAAYVDVFQTNQGLPANPQLSGRY